MPDKTVEERVADLEKGMADLTKNTTDIATMVKSLDNSFKKAVDDLKKELVIPGKDTPPEGAQNPPPPIKKEEQDLRKMFNEELKKALNEMGFTASGTPSSTPRPNLAKEHVEDEDEDDKKKGVKKSGVQTPPDDGYAMFESNYNKLMSQRINKGMDPSKEPSFMEYGAQMMGVPKEG